MTRLTSTKIESVSSMPALIELSLGVGAWFWKTGSIVLTPLFYYLISEPQSIE